MQQGAAGTTVNVLPPSDRGRANAALTVAFASDPMIRWVLSAPDAYLQVWPSFVEAFAGEAYDRGTAFAVEHCSAVALWLAPGAVSDGEAMQPLMSEGSDPSISADLDGVFEQMEAFHPSFEHWYLPLIGVDPLAQGRGLGTALMHHVLTDLDRAGACLSRGDESTKPDHVRAPRLRSNRPDPARRFTTDVADGSLPNVDQDARGTRLQMVRLTRHEPPMRGTGLRCSAHRVEAHVESAHPIPAQAAHCIIPTANAEPATVGDRVTCGTPTSPA